MADESTADESIEAAYQGRRGQMVGVARKLLEDEGIPDSKIGAEDVVQNAYLKALQKQQATPIDQAGAYVFAVLRNQVRDEARRRDNTTLSMPEYDTPVTVRQAHPGPAEQVHQRIVLRSALRRLSPRQRRMVLMTRHMGYTHAEAARSIGIRASSASVHVLRGTLALRTLLAGAVMVVAGVCVKVLGLLDGGTELASTGRGDSVVVHAEDLAWGGLYVLLLLGVGTVLFRTLTGNRGICSPVARLLTGPILAAQLTVTANGLRVLLHGPLHPPGRARAVAALDWLNVPHALSDNVKLLVGTGVFLCWLVRWREDNRRNGRRMTGWTPYPPYRPWRARVHNPDGADHRSKGKSGSADGLGW